MPRRIRSRDPHGWNLLNDYLFIHERSVQNFIDEGFVTEDRLAIARTRPDSIVHAGRMRCINGLFIDVRNTLDIRLAEGKLQVRTSKYPYHAGVEGRSARTILRYDNAHPYTREGHPDAHHKHRFDPVTWREITPPEWVGEDAWPHLSDVLAELRDWWESTGRFLDLE